MPEERVLQQGHMKKCQDTGVWLLAVHFYILTSTHHLHHQFSDGRTFHTLLFLKDSNLCRDVWPPPLNATFRNDKPSHLKIGVNRHIQENITHDQTWPLWSCYSWYVHTDYSVSLTWAGYTNITRCPTLRPVRQFFWSIVSALVCGKLYLLSFLLG